MHTRPAAPEGSGGGAGRVTCLGVGTRNGFQSPVLCRWPNAPLGPRPSCPLHGAGVAAREILPVPLLIRKCLMIVPR